ncbi:MAG: AbrB/MazE/SpoVT family DNA-binding domain-containing protein [Rhodospirillales bacterium]|nr:AbrB/MazE/SpoVT family DNA-binding domain-containing protein [Rhodospirillales bacterium]
MLSTETLTKLSEGGKLNLPASMRRELGIEPGSQVLLRVEDGELRVRALAAGLRDLQASARRIFAGSNESVDRFLADRRAEAASEDIAG